MNEQFMQILQAIGPEAMLVIIQTLAQMDEQQLQQVVEELQAMLEQGGGAQPQEGMAPPQSQANANLYGPQ